MILRILLEAVPAVPVALMTERVVGLAMTEA